MNIKEVLREALVCLIYFALALAIVCAAIAAVYLIYGLCFLAISAWS